MYRKNALGCSILRPASSSQSKILVSMPLVCELLNKFSLELETRKGTKVGYSYRSVISCHESALPIYLFSVIIWKESVRPSLFKAISKGPILIRI